MIPLFVKDADWLEALWDLEDIDHLDDSARFWWVLRSHLKLRAHLHRDTRRLGIHHLQIFN